MTEPEIIVVMREAIDILKSKIEESDGAWLLVDFMSAATNESHWMNKVVLAEQLSQPYVDTIEAESMSERSALVDDEVLIRYRYPGTSEGKPVGDVYVTIPQFGSGFSHTYLVNEASRFTRLRAADLIASKSMWRHAGAHPVAANEAEDLR